MLADGVRAHRLGLILVALAAVSWSTAGLFVRFISADLMTMLFWRGLFSGAGVMAIFLLLEGKAALAILKRLGWPALAVMCASTMSMISGISAIRFTTVADALMIYATLPFMTAALAWATIGERPARSTMIASAVALAGFAIMLKDSAWDGSLLGKAFAVFMTLGMAIMTTIMRRHREVPMLPALGASAWLCSFVTFWFAASLAITPQDLALCALFGVIQNAAGLAFYAIGSRRVPAAEATLIAALEVPLTPLWVWMVLAEVPSGATLFGGLIVLAAMFGHMFAELRRERTGHEPSLVRPDPERLRLLLEIRDRARQAAASRR
jgi:drug/metabolite transporter (DMT)-like permease